MLKKLMSNRFYRVTKLIIRQIGKNDVSGNAAQLAYYMLFSIFPMLLIAATLLAYVNIDRDSVFNLIQEFAPKEIIKFLEGNLDSLLSKRNGGLLSIGIIATLWSASNGMNAVTKALNKAYNVTDRRNFILQRLLSMVFTVAMIATIGVTLILLVFGQQIGLFIFNHLHVSKEFVDFWNNTRWLITVVVIFVVFVFLYWVAPAKRNRFLGVLPGAIFSTVGWSITSLGFAYYVNNFANYSATYGSIGVIIILMLWFYLTGIILMVGGELNAAFAVLKQKRVIGEIN
ncbi:YihY/virulence factor BrkB family protein [Listeria aquatica]|uniref:YihY/virulence factor BrkB family protein n=2 Tax=Listeria aquatica TaxID=1494960 RepID=A0A841ZT05_9LIST|nr:YihY/virulence factor BrkB family protein [Listeria aquatica]